MDTTSPISDEVRGAVQFSYLDTQRENVLARLSTISNEWERRSILILANGDHTILCELIEYAKLDWREIPFRIGELPPDELVRRRNVMGLSLPQTAGEKNAERLRSDVTNFIAEAVIVSADQLSDSTQLQSDLALAGVDGDRFIRAFAERFNIDLDGYDCQKHFASKPGDNFWADLTMLVFGHKKATTIPITVRDLIAAAETHRWMASPNG